MGKRKTRFFPCCSLTCSLLKKQPSFFAACLALHRNTDKFFLPWENIRPRLKWYKQSWRASGLQQASAKHGSDVQGYIPTLKAGSLCLLDKTGCMLLDQGILKLLQLGTGGMGLAVGADICFPCSLISAAETGLCSPTCPYFCYKQFHMVCGLVSLPRKIELFCKVH